MNIHPGTTKDLENVEPHTEEKTIENVSAGDLLAQYSEKEKTNALRRLDWNLIPLYDLFRSHYSCYDHITDYLL